MATAVSFPGVYIEEVPSSVRTIAGVATSVTAFVGFTARGPTNEAVQIFSFADFERRFGGLDVDSDLSYAVSQFFLNGGSQAWIVRVAHQAAAAAINLRNTSAGGVVVLTAIARSEGLWGNALRLGVDYDSANPASLFNLTVSEVQERNGRLSVTRSETYRNLSMDSASPAYAVAVVNAGSNLVQLERPNGLPFGPAATAVSGILTQPDLDRLGENARRLAIALDGSRGGEFDFLQGGGDALAGGAFAARMADLALRIQNGVRAIDPGDPAYANFTCAATVNGAQGVLEATSGTQAGDEEGSAVVFSTAGRRNAAVILRLGAANGGRETSGSAALRPAPTGTAWVRQDPPLDFATLDSPGSIDVDLIDPAGTVLFHQVIALWPNDPARPVDLATLRTQLQAAFAGSVRAEFAGARVTISDERIVVTAGGDNPALRIRFNAGPTAGAINLVAAAQMNVAAYQLGVGPVLEAQSDPAPGADGTAPTLLELQGSRADKTGIFALEDVDLFNILTLPNQSDPALQAAATAYAEERRAFVVLDFPDVLDTVDEARAHLAAHGELRHRNAAAYFPRVRMADPLQNNRVRSFANSGAIAGAYARTDAARGVWKAPAGHRGLDPRSPGARLCADRPRERGPEPAGPERHPHLPRLRPRRLGRADAGRGQTPRHPSGSTYRFVAWPCSSRRASTAAPSGSCSSRTTSRCGRRSG